MLLIECGLILLALVVACVWPTAGSQWFGRWESGFRWLAIRPRLAVITVGMAALSLRAALLPILPIPEPLVHDEFGYLLAADTFAHGRLANPTPAMWVHFETFHAMFQPTYASIYPPAPGFILAAGRLIAGNPYWGVWLSVGVMCAAICWMLQGWMSPQWALLGAGLAVLRYAVFGYWANSYWGGSAGAIGGALVLGALPRIKAFQRVGDALLMGVGLAILANSRPYEGFVLSLPIAVMLFAWMFGRNKPEFKTVLRRVIFPLVLVLAVTAAGMSYYFWRVTGNPFRMPYQVERSTYAVAPYMIWQHVRPEPVYRHAVIRKMYVEEELLGLRVFRSPTGLLMRAYLSWRFFLGPLLTVPLILLALTLPRSFGWREIDPSTRALLAVLAVSAAGSLLVNFYSAHYSSPATGLIVAVVTLAMRQLRRWNPAGLFLARSLALICVVMFVVRAAVTPLHIPISEAVEYAWYQTAPGSVGRAALQRQLQQASRKQLVIVRYAPDHEPFREWVYNEADIDGSKVIWARDMDPVENEQLIHYYNDRQVWLLQADEKPPRVSEVKP